MNKTTTKKTGTVSTPTSRRTIKLTEQDIRQRAFEIYLERGAVSGNEYEDWSRAEKELKNPAKRK